MVESTAAAMAYGLLVAGEKTVLIYDMGGGTTDLTILYINNGRYEIRYTYGNSQLGGNDVDQLLVEYVTQAIVKGPSLNRIALDTSLYLLVCISFF